jgi:hypothetical protein
MKQPGRSPREAAPVARRWWLAWGLASAGLLLAAAFFVQQGVPVRILFDGQIPPQPYRWVHPPSNLAATNQPPLPGEGDVPLTGTGSGARSVPTGDGQAIVIFAQDGVAPREGESSIHIKVTALDPATLPPLPAGRKVDGNAYRIDATYATSRQPAVLHKPITVDLRYPIHAQEILRLSDSTWKVLETTRFDTSLTLVAFSDQLGIFVMAVAPGAPAGLPSWWPYAAAAAGLLVAVIALLLARRRGPRGPRPSQGRGRRGPRGRVSR